MTQINSNSKRLWYKRDYILVFAIIAIVLILFLSLIAFFPIHPGGNPGISNETILNGEITVEQNSYNVYSFVVPKNAYAIWVNGSFASDNSTSIKVYVMDNTTLNAWKQGNSWTAYYDSGETFAANISVYLPDKIAATYYVVYDNSFSPVVAKVSSYINLVYMFMP